MSIQVSYLSLVLVLVEVNLKKKEIIKKIHGTTCIHFYFFVLFNKNFSSQQLCMYRNLQCINFVWYIIISLVYLKEKVFLSWVDVKYSHLACKWHRAMSNTTLNNISVSSVIYTLFFYPSEWYCYYQLTDWYWKLSVSVTSNTSYYQ